GLLLQLRERANDAGNFTERKQPRNILHAYRLFIHMLLQYFQLREGEQHNGGTRQAILLVNRHIYARDGMHLPKTVFAYDALCQFLLQRNGLRLGEIPFMQRFMIHNFYRASAIKIIRGLSCSYWLRS